MLVRNIFPDVLLPVHQNGSMTGFSSAICVGRITISVSHVEFVGIKLGLNTIANNDRSGFVEPVFVLVAVHAMI